MYVSHPELFEFFHHPLLVFGIARETGDATPPFWMARIAKATGNFGLLNNILVDFVAVDWCIGLLSLGEGKFDHVCIDTRLGIGRRDQRLGDNGSLCWLC